MPSARQCRLTVEPKLLTQEAQNPRKPKRGLLLGPTWTFNLSVGVSPFWDMLYLRVHQRYYNPVSFGCSWLICSIRHKAEISLAAETRDRTLLMVQIPPQLRYGELMIRFGFIFIVHLNKFKFIVLYLYTQQYMASYYMISKDRLVDFHANMMLKDFWPHTVANGPCILVPNISIVISLEITWKATRKKQPRW